MKNQSIFDQISTLKEKFKGFFQQRKQITALENHALVRRFSDVESEVLSTIKTCMKGAFLQEEDAEWMNRKLDRLQINYLDWAHRTKWLKDKIQANKVAPKPVIIQTFFQFDRKPQTPHVPVELLNQANAIQKSARI